MASPSYLPLRSCSRFVQSSASVLYRLSPDPGLRPGSPPRLLPPGDVELYGPHRGVLRHYVLHHGYDVRPET